MKRYILQYDLPYVHHVEVGIQATSGEDAIETARTMLDDGSLFDNAETAPWLYDDYWEEDAGPLVFTIKNTLELDQDWPKPDASVRHIWANEAALRACRILLKAYQKGDMLDPLLLDEAVTYARKAQHEMGMEV